MDSTPHPPHLRIIGGLDEALRHSRGETQATEHRIPAAQRRIADDYQRRCEQLDQQPPDYPTGPRFVRPIDRSMAARNMGEPQELVDLYSFAKPRRLTFGERLVLFFRVNGDLCVGICVGIGIGALLTAALAYAVRLAVLS